MAKVGLKDVIQYEPAVLNSNDAKWREKAGRLDKEVEDELLLEGRKGVDVAAQSAEKVFLQAIYT